MSVSKVEAATAWVELASKVLLIAGSCIAAVWALYQYLDHRQEGRVSATLGYAQRMSGDRLQGSMERISAAWLAARGQLRALDQTKVVSADQFQARRRQLVLSVIARAGRLGPSGGTVVRGLDGDIDAVVAFFEELNVCVNAHICDPDTARSYFAGLGQRFYCLHEPYIADKRASYSAGYGDGIRALALNDATDCASVVRGGARPNGRTGAASASTSP